MSDKLDIKLFYLSCHNLLKNRYGINSIVTRKEIYCELGKHFLIPKNLRDVAIKELEEMNLIKKKDRDNLIILGCDLDIERDANKFMQILF